MVVPVLVIIVLVLVLAIPFLVLASVVVSVWITGGGSPNVPDHVLDQ